MKPARIRLGMVGGGQGAFIGAVHRIAARLDDEYELVAAALSSDAQRAAASARELGLDPARSYDDFRAMARAEAMRPDGIEVVAIVTPNHLHVPVASAFIEAGIHVICDKPLATSLVEAQALATLAARHGRVVALTHNYTGYPLVRAARALVASGELGDIRLLRTEYAQGWLASDLEASGNKQAAWRTDPALAGPAGCLGDIGSHAAHLAEYVCAMSPTELSAELVSFVPGRRVDDHLQIQFRYANGARGMLWASQVATGEENHLTLNVYGTKAALHWDQEQPNELWLHRAGSAAQRLTRGGPGLPEAGREAASAATRIPPGHPEGYLEAFATIYRDVAADLRAARETKLPVALRVPGLPEALRSMALIETALASSRANGEWTPLPTLAVE